MLHRYLEDLARHDNLPCPYCGGDRLSSDPHHGRAQPRPTKETKRA